mmetsp:Transcript_2709/g.2519  ORF Transcript_2709/g.2519 Transcript_2709/m.2519 type:complete len:199 (+) Transcript_2709:2160-2756(+)
MRLTFLSMLNLRHIRFDDTLAIISSCLGIIGAIAVFGYPLYEGWNVKQFSTELKTGLPPTQFRLHILYSDFKVSSPFQYAYFWQFFLRRFLFVGMIISWPQDKYLTLCLSTIMHMASMMYVAIVLPFTSRTKNIAVMISEGGIVAMHGYLFPIMRGDFSNELSFYHDKAFIFFLVVFLVIVVHLVLIIFDSIAHVKRV